MAKRTETDMLTFKNGYRVTTRRVVSNYWSNIIQPNLQNYKTCANTSQQHSYKKKVLLEKDV
jgi:hypothetical protein